MRLRRVFVFGALAITAIAQQQQVFRSDTRLVQVDVIVRNDKGPVTGLTKDDFQVFDNGTKREISSFSIAVSQSAGASVTASAPSGTGANRAPAERPVSATVIFIDNLAIRFVDQVQSRKRIAEIMNKLPPREPIALYALNNSLRLMTDFTDDPVRIARALANSGGEIPQPSDPYNPVPPVFPALEQIANQLASWPGHKNLLWIANSFPVPDPVKDPVAHLAMARTLKALNAANVSVYPITAAGVNAPPLYTGQAGRGAMMAIQSAMAAGRNLSQGASGMDQNYWADQTGGIAATNTDPGFATERALDDAQVTYSLGFSPESLDGEYHKLSVKVNRRNVEVRSRQGYVAAPPVDLIAGKIAGAALETKAAASANPGTLNITMQAPYFYSGTNRARVHLTLEVTPAAMEFKKVQKGLHGQLEFVGTVSRTDGGEAARFSETVEIDRDTQENADDFMRMPYRYEHEFLVAPGSYVFQMTVGAGPKAFGKTQTPLNVDPWNAATFGIGGIALSTFAREVPEGFSSDKTLVAGGSAFVPSATNRFQNSDRLYFYTEIYEPPAPTSLSIQYRVVDRKTGAVAMDSGMVSASNYIHPGNTTIPFATTVPIGHLSPGTYRLEVKAAQTLDANPVTRTADFEILPGARPATESHPAARPIATRIVNNDPLIESAKKAASAYVDSLPDYVVKRATTRYAGNRPSVTAPPSEILHWRILNLVIADVSDEHGREVYTNIRVNDKPEKILPSEGIWSSGEFSSDLIAIFGEKSAAVFTNPRSDTIRKRSVAVYDFFVDQPHSIWSVVASQDMNEKPDLYFPAYGGTVWIDRETGQTLRLSMQARDLPPDYPLDTVDSITDFDFVKIADETYVMPIHSDAYTCHRGGTGCFRNESVFRDYGKFTAGSIITFDK